MLTQSEKRKAKSGNLKWLPDMDLNHDKQIQSLLCYRYTIGQTSAFKVNRRRLESRLVTGLKRCNASAALRG